MKHLKPIFTGIIVAVILSIMSISVFAASANGKYITWKPSIQVYVYGKSTLTASTSPAQCKYWSGTSTPSGYNMSVISTYSDCYSNYTYLGSFSSYKTNTNYAANSKTFSASRTYQIRTSHYAKTAYGSVNFATDEDL